MTKAPPPKSPHVFSALIMWSIGYAAIAFVEQELNPSLWHWAGRAALVAWMSAHLCYFVKEYRDERDGR